MSSRSKKILLGILFLVLAVCFCYSSVGGFEFLRFDDHDYTFRCAFVHNGLSLANVQTAFTSVRHAAIWMPVTYVTYMADISLFGPGMGPHHLVNVACHALTAVALFLLLLRLFPGRVGFGFVAALLWALHPQRVEAVAWIAGRKEILCGFFTLLGLLAWERGTWRGYVLGAFGCLLACMSKPTAMCFPFLAVTVDMLSPRVSTRPAASLRRVLPYVPLVLMAVATGALAVYSQTHADGYDVRTLFSASLPWRMLNALVALGLYLFQMFVPMGIHLDYRAVPEHFPLHGVLGLTTLALAVAGLAVVCLWLGRHGETGRTARRNLLVLLVGWFGAALAPTLGIFGSFGEHARADRFLYVPAMAFAVLLVPVLTKAAQIIQAHLPSSHAWVTRRLVPTGLTVLVLVYAGAALPVIASYRNDFTAFSRTLAFDSDHGRALAHVASEECARNGRIDRGITLFRRSQEVRPRDDTAAQLAYALMMRGLSSDYAEIRRLCAKFACDHTRDRKGMALEALGTTAMRQRKWTEAITCLEDSIRAPARFYSAEDATLRLAACYANARRTDDALRTLQPLTQSKRADIRSQARQALDTLRANPKSLLFF